jgi:hypothetical protein
VNLPRVAKLAGTAVVLSALLLPVTSGRAAPPRYQVGERGLVLDGVTADSPVIYDNDWWTDVPDAAYLWAKASLGKCNLRGNIITRCTFGWEKGYAHKMSEQTQDCDKLWKAAQASGLKNIPKPVVGAAAALRKPASGVVAETRFAESPGSRLIVAEARKATAKKPLLVFCGGSCTTLATAYLTDPTIADKVIVFQIDGGGYNGSDGWAWKIAMTQFRFANWARGYFWKEVNTWDPKVFNGLPANPLGELLRKYARSGLGKANQWGDGAWVYHYFDSRCLSRAEEYGKDAITIPKSGTNAKRMREEFLTTLTNPAVYHTK